MNIPKTCLTPSRTGNREKVVSERVLSWLNVICAIGTHTPLGRCVARVIRHFYYLIAIVRLAILVIAVVCYQIVLVDSIAPRQLSSHTPATEYLRGRHLCGLVVITTLLRCQRELIGKLIETRKALLVELPYKHLRTIAVNSDTIAKDHVLTYRINLLVIVHLIGAIVSVVVPFARGVAVALLRTDEHVTIERNLYILTDLAKVVIIQYLTNISNALALLFPSHRTEETAYNFLASRIYL